MWDKLVSFLECFYLPMWHSQNKTSKAEMCRQVFESGLCSMFVKDVCKALQRYGKQLGSIVKPKFNT